MSNDTTEPKQCGKCKGWFPRNSDYFHKNTSNRDGLYYWCKACTKEYRRLKIGYYDRTKKKEEKLGSEVKICSRCNKQFPKTPSIWYRAKNSPDGLSNRCIECDRKYSKQYYQNHKDDTHLKARIKKWRNDNREKTNSYNRERYRNDPDSILRSTNEWNNNNKERRSVYQKQWALENKDRTRNISNKRRAIKKRAPGFFTEEEVKHLYHDQKGVCFHCEADLRVTGYHRDHWIPLSRGGSNWIENIRLLCPRCNRSKGKKLPNEWDGRYK